jgi:AmmeMemoRadiSam system protein A
MVRSGRPPAAGIALDDKQKKALLALARQTVAQGAAGQQPQALLLDDPVLNLPAAVFVTLTEAGQLRGCVGTTEPRATLRDAVASSAFSAGFEDQRFSPVAKDEVAKLHFEISILSSARRVSSAESIVPKKHGVIVSQGRNLGLFLPQVWEQIPDKVAFLSELCQEKAQLPRDCWKDPKTRLAVFTVSAFEEPQSAPSRR